MPTACWMPATWYSSTLPIPGSAASAEIGAYLLGLWGLPYPVIEAVARHHEPERIASGRFDVLSALVVALALSGTDDGDAFRVAPPRAETVGPAYLKGLEAPFTWSEAEARAVAFLAAPDAAVGGAGIV